MSSPLAMPTPSLPFSLFGMGGVPELAVCDGVMVGDALSNAATFLELLNRELSRTANALEEQGSDQAGSIWATVCLANLAAAFVRAAEAGLMADAAAAPAKSADVCTIRTPRHNDSPGETGR